MKRLLVVFATAWLLSGCAVLSQLLAAAFQQPTFRFKNAALDNVTFEGMQLDTVWQLDNPNAVALSLASVEYALFIDDKQVVAGTPPAGLKIPAQGSTELKFPAAVKWLEIVPALETLFTKDEATWRVEGVIATAYATVLWQMAQAATRRPTAAAAYLAMAQRQPGKLEQRVRRILAPARRKSRVLGAVDATIWLAAALLLFVCSVCRPVANDVPRAEVERRFAANPFPGG